MVAPNTNPIRCTVVAVPDSTDRCSTRGALARDLVPWADPYVLQLIRKLQDEVRQERAERARRRRERLYDALELDSPLPDESAWALDIDDDLEMPWDETPSDRETVDADWRPQYGDESEETTLER
jgi:hypothetical protein